MDNGLVFLQREKDVPKNTFRKKKKTTRPENLPAIPFARNSSRESSRLIGRSLVDTSTVALLRTPALMYDPTLTPHFYVFQHILGQSTLGSALLGAQGSKLALQDGMRVSLMGERVWL